MKPKFRNIPAGVFKNRCLAIMDEIAQNGSEVVVTKHGRPVVRVVPADLQLTGTSQAFGSLTGSVRYNEDDLTSSVEDSWDADHE